MTCAARAAQHPYECCGPLALFSREQRLSRLLKLCPHRLALAQTLRQRLVAAGRVQNVRAMDPALGLGRATGVRVLLDGLGLGLGLGLGDVRDTLLRHHEDALAPCGEKLQLVQHLPALGHCAEYAVL